MTSAGASICTDSSDAIELYSSLGLFLKPIARVNVCVQLPPLKEAGKSISNWEVMERIKAMIKPHSFTSLKIIKSTMEFIRFEGEAENKELVVTIMHRLEGKSIKLSGFPEQLKVKAGEAKIQFPSRHDWDSYFRDAKNMNEMKPGERPDTIHIRDIPTRWFAGKHSKEKDKPSEDVLKRVFNQFGDIRCVDIPMLDPYRKEMSGLVKSGTIQTFTFGQDLVFDAFIQFKEYIGFVKAMDRLRGMKLLYIDEDDKCAVANVRVDFDKSKHLTDKSIRKRRLERERLEQLELEREERVKKERSEQERKIAEEKRQKDEEEMEREKKRLEKLQRREERRIEREQERKIAEEKRMKDEEEMEREKKRLEKLQRREERRIEREEKRKEKHQEKRRKEEERKMQLKIALEERKFLLTQRKLESLRLLTELFERVKVIKVKEDVELKEKELEEERKRQVDEEIRRKEEEERMKKEALKRKKELLKKQENELREKILKKWKSTEEQKQEQLREELRKKLSGKRKLKSAVVMKR